jgi:phage repressor protein C with HTH and peptisase S24 domain
VDDVRIGEYRRPWNARPEARRLARGIPRAPLWAYDPNGIEQVGCVYTAQGFEFDYVGVIFGPDLRYNLDSQAWEGHRGDSKDNEVRRGGERFVDLVKNTYRVLLSRGLKGCYVHFMDKDTERFVRSRMEKSALATAEEPVASHKGEGRPATAGRYDDLLDPRPRSSRGQALRGDDDETRAVEPFRRLRVSEARPFENCVPLYDLAVAAGQFSEEQQSGGVRLGEEDRQPEAVEWVELPEAFKPRRGMFVARVVGESMNRRIPNGAWCLFRVAGAGTRQGKVVLAQHREIEDAETGGHFTVKVYESRKEPVAATTTKGLDSRLRGNDDPTDGSWRHAAIVLRPDTTAPGFEPIELKAEEAEDLRIVAELVAVLG